jgi:hypothetical protein
MDQAKTAFNLYNFSHFGENSTTPRPTKLPEERLRNIWTLISRNSWRKKTRWKPNVNGINKKTDHMAKENVSRETNDLRSNLVLDLQMPGATKEEADYPCKRWPRWIHSRRRTSPRRNTNVMSVNHWNILP